MLSLRSNRLRVEIAEPGEAPNITTRFDRAGFITDIVLDGIHRFCATEPNNLSHPPSGGRGLCNEYVFDVSGDAAVGELFPKLGVGLLKKETPEPYNFAGKYEVSQPFPVSVQTEKNRVVFSTNPIECLGYSVSQIKTVEVIENELSITVSLTNTGHMPIEGGEYCHNFLTINGMALGPDYELNFENAQDLGAEASGGLLSLSGSSVTIPRYGSAAGIEHISLDKIIQGPAFRWTLSNPAAGARIRVNDEIDLSQLVVWAADHMISVESFHKLSLKPGESSTWKRIWLFESY